MLADCCRVESTQKYGIKTIFLPALQSSPPSPLKFLRKGTIKHFPQGHGPASHQTVQAVQESPQNMAITPTFTVSVLGRDSGYTVKYNPLLEGVPEGKA